MAQGSLPSQQDMEVDLRRQLNDVFGKFDDFAGIIGGTKQLFGVVPTSGVMRGLTPYSTNRLPPNASLPPASLCLQEMKNVPPLIPPLQVNRNEIENSGCASEASSSNSHVNDDENDNRPKKRKRNGNDEDDEGTTKRKGKREDNKIMRDLFDDDNDDEKGNWRDRINNLPRQGIKRLIESMQVEPLLSPIDADRILKKNEEDEEREERDKVRRKEREESEKRRRDKSDYEDKKKRKDGDEERKRKKDDEDDRRKDERRRRKEDDERKRKREDEERKRKEVDDNRKKNESEKEEEEKRIRKEKKKQEKEEKRVKEEEEKKKEEERERRRKEEDEERKKRLEKEEEMRREKENREREEFAMKIEEEKKREAERIRNEEEKKKEADRIRKEEEIRKREIDDRRKREEDEKKKKEEEDRMKRERKKEEEKRKQKEEEKERRRKDDIEKGRKEKEKDKKGSLPLNALPNSKLEALKEKEKERRRREKNLLNESKDEKNISLSIWNEKKKKEFKEEKSKEKKVKDPERSTKKEESSARSSPLSSKNSSRVATPIPPISLPSTSTHHHGGSISPSSDIRFSFPHCPSSSCLAYALTPQSAPILEQRADIEGYTSYAKEKKHRGDATSDRVLRFCHYMESCMYFSLSVSTCHPSKSSDRELSMAGCVVKDTIDLLKHAIVLFEKEGISHMTSRTKLLCLRTQAILNYHMYYFRTNKFPRRSDALVASLESQVQEIPRASPKKEENGSGGKKIGDKSVTPSPSSSSLSSNSNVTMPMSLWKMKTSQVQTYAYLETANSLWHESTKHITSNERHYWNTIDNLIVRKFDWGCPLHIGSSLIHLSNFINIAVSWMREEYEAEKSR